MEEKYIVTVFSLRYKKRNEQGMAWLDISAQLEKPDKFTKMGIYY